MRRFWMRVRVAQTEGRGSTVRVMAVHSEIEGGVGTIERVMVGES
jgi:predicted thioesterase